MQNIHEECDTCLASQAAADLDGKHIFKDNDTTVAWAALAEECGLKTLWPTQSFSWSRTLTPAFWQSSAFYNYQISLGCMLRMLQAAQLNMKEWSSRFTPGVPQQERNAVCCSCKTGVWCSQCAKLFGDELDEPTGTHASLSQMISWQQSSNDGALDTTSARSGSVLGAV